MRNLIAFPLLGLAVILQSAVVSQVKLLSGYADLPLVLLAAWALQERVKTSWHWGVLVCLYVGFVSSLSVPVIVIGYLAVVFLARVLRKASVAGPLLAMFSVVFLGTIFFHMLSFIVLSFSGTPLMLEDIVFLLTLPSLLLNMLLAVPMYAFMRDVSYWVYPIEE